MVHAAEVTTNVAGRVKKSRMAGPRYNTGFEKVDGGTTFQGLRVPPREGQGPRRPDGSESRESETSQWPSKPWQAGDGRRD